MLGFNDYRDGDVTIAIGTGDDLVLAGWEVHGYDILKDGSGVIVDFAEQMSFGGQDAVVGVFLPVGIRAVKIGIPFVGGVHYQGAIGRITFKCLPRGTNCDKGQLISMGGATNQCHG